MNILKHIAKLFRPKPIPQREINLGKLTATVILVSGKVLTYHWEGKYRGSNYYYIYGDFWSDDFDTARSFFESWMKRMGKYRFLETEDGFIPISDIAKITRKEEDLFVVTNRTRD